ncbi:MAG TPA: VWA domain-containing protein [candidate division Zixibacteria bacterium]|nr:VWA domain-containing protein [candidate division Zixibacteria bacterium]
MLWGAPYAWLLLLGVVPLIVFLHSLRRRGAVYRTTAFFIWERVLQQRPLGSRLGRLVRKNLLLALQLLAATALIAALADPALLYFGAPPGDVVVVIDLGASMKAGAASGSRFDAARRELLSLIDRLAPGQRMMLIGAGPEPRVLAPLTSDARRLRETARRISPTDAPGRVREAVLFAHAFLKQGSADRVVVISDGAFAGADRFSWQAPHLRLIQVSGGKDNIGITGFEVRRRSGQPSLAEIMVHVKNFTAAKAVVPVVITLGTKTVARDEMELEAGGRRVRVFPYAGPFEGLLEARLDVKDDFATDNRAYLALAPAAPVRLLYVGPGNPFLSRLLGFFPEVQVASVESWPPDSTSADAAPPDVVVFDRVPVPPLDRGNFILIDTVAPNLPLQPRGKMLHPRVLSVTRHRVTEGLRLGDLFVRQATRAIDTGGRGKALAQTAEGPLLWAFEGDMVRALWIGFNLLDSDLPFRVAFPLLLHNAIDWLRPGRAEFPSRATRSGHPYELSLGSADETVEITVPSGRKENLAVTGQRAAFSETLEAGFYTFRSSSRSGSFGVNLFDEAESDIEPRLRAPPGASRSGSAEAPGTESGRPLWPYLLAFVVVVLAVETALAWRAGLSWAPAAARSAAFAALALAFFDPKIVTPATLLDVVVGVDVSRSVGREGLESARETLEAASRHRSPELRTGLLFFAAEPVWEFPPQPDFQPADVLPPLDREASNLQAALQAALARFGEGRQKRVLLVTDGNENRGRSSAIVPLLRAQGVEVWPLPVGLSRAGNEIYLSDLQLPREVDSAETFEIRAAVESRAPAAARVRLLRDGVVAGERQLVLRGGTNWVTFRASLQAQGGHHFEVLVESSDDTLPENNILQGVVEVRGPPRVLYIASGGEEQRLLARALRTQGYAVSEASPGSRALDLVGIASFDLVVLDNVAAYALAQREMEAIERYVRDLGGGLWVVGGAQSYGAGGYYKTPFEKLLPLDMRPPARLDLPQVALLFVIDKSGSMGSGPEGGTKLDLAKAAALAAADIMNPTDQVGILGFDAAWDWVLPFRPVGKGEWISEKLASLSSDGGTDLYKALVEAHRAIAGRKAAVKHVLVLSDGLTDKMDFASLVGAMARDGITVSTVAVGGDADFKLMAEIARTGKGRGYVTLDPESIPQIFTTETLLIARELLVEKPTQPAVVAATGPLRGFGGVEFPPLHGYVLTYPKSGAALLMKAGPDPLLASWRYGLGRVTAFTSDLSSRWGREWVRWESFPKWASQVARDAMRRLSSERLRAEFRPEEDGLRVIADVVSSEGDFLNGLELRGKLTAGQATEERPLLQVAPGRYEGRFSTAVRGVNLLTIYTEMEPGGSSTVLKTVPYVSPYPQEYRELGPNRALLGRLAEQTGGKIVERERLEEGIRALYTPGRAKGAREQETWWPLCGAALLLFVGDLVLRHWPVQKPSVAVRVAAVTPPTTAG